MDSIAKWNIPANSAIADKNNRFKLLPADVLNFNCRVFSRYS